MAARRNPLAFDTTGRNRRAPVPNELVRTAQSTDTPMGGGMWDDPNTQLFQSLAQNRIGQLSQPFNDPALDDVVRMIKGQIGKAGAPVSFAPMNIGYGGNPLLQDFITSGRQRIEELNQEPFSDQEEARYRTKALESVEGTRTASRQRAKEDIARRGMADTSGILLDMERGIDRGADSDRTSAEADLAMYITGERNKRKDAASQLAAQLAAAGGQEAGMAMQGNIANAQLNSARELTGASMTQANQQAIMSMAGMLADLAAQKRGESRANQNDILSIAQMLANLGPQRLAMAMSVLNGSPDPGSVLNSTMNLSNTQANTRNQSNAAQASLMSGLGNVLAYIAANSKGGGGGVDPTFLNRYGQF